jgi:hypothetical protein
MSFLAELSQHLKTDVADIARASVDPAFAQQLTEKQFRREEREEIREADQRKIAEERAAREEAAALQRKSAAQMKVLNGAFEHGRDTGDFNELINVMGSENLIPEVRDFGELLVNSQPGQSLESIIKEQRLKNDTRRLDQQDKSLMLQQKRLDSADERFQQEFLFKQARFAYDQAIELARQQENVVNVQALSDSIQQNESGIWTQEEKDGWTMAMGAADPKQALAIYNRAWTQYNQKMQLLAQQRKSSDAAGTDTPALNVNVSENDLNAAATFIQAQENFDEERFADIPEPERFALTNYVAATANQLARNNKGTTPEQWLPAAYSEALRGIEFTSTLGVDGARFDINKVVRHRDDKVRVYNPVTGQLE